MLETPKPNTWDGNSPKNVIAMVANVAAFGLCGSSQKSRHWGEEQFKIVWEGKHHTSPPLGLHQDTPEWAIISCKSGENGVILTLSRLNLTPDYIFPKDTNPREKVRTWHSTIHCKIPDHLKQQKGYLCNCVQFWKEIFPKGRRCTTCVCQKKRKVG